MTPSVDLLISGGDLVSGEGRRRADVAIRDGVITEIGPDLSTLDAATRLDARGRSVLPGLFDAHNHPYYEENLEHFSRAAAYGGITTLVPYVAGRPMSGGAAQDIVPLAEAFVDEVERTSYLDCGGHTILSEGDLTGPSIPALRALGFNSFKAFLAFPGIRMLTDDQLFTAMQQIARAGGICMVHCENGPVTDLLERQFREEGHLSGTDYLASRPIELEDESVYRSLSLAAVAGCPVYIVHITSQESMRIIEEFRRRQGPPIYAETCPHYLTLTGADQAAMGPRGKISPPCRSAADREGLWASLTSGAVDVVATDASGQLLRAKESAGDDYLAAPYGVPGVEEFVRVLVASATARGIDPLPIIARTLAERPAAIFGMGSRKGAIEVGKDADLALFDPGAAWEVRAADQHGRSDYSLYEGLSGTGTIVWTCQQGRPVLADGTVHAAPGSGTFIRAE